MYESIRSLFTQVEWDIICQMNPNICTQIQHAPLELQIEEERISEFHEQRFVETPSK